MNASDIIGGYGVLTDPATLQIERLLPGPIERVWSYVTDGNLRRKWFAGGDDASEVGAPFELVWRNDELTDPPGERPDGAGKEHRMQSRILEIEPLRKLTIAWGSGGTGTVSFELNPKGSDVLLTIIHSGIQDRSSLLNFAPGWHTHLDVLAARLAEKQPEPFWDQVARLKAEYAERLPA